jgi:nucleotide-binding universal stress UspA family protein
MNYLVALDSSENSKVAFYEALNLIKDKEKDQLFLIGVIDEVKIFAWETYALVPPDIMIKAEESRKKECSNLLRKYGKVAQNFGIKNLHLLVGISNHVGELLCQVIELKKIDFLFVGRRGLGKFKRILLGSTSRYCVEHASCTVIVIKEKNIEKDELKDMAEEEPLVSKENNDHKSLEIVKVDYSK